MLHPMGGLSFGNRYKFLIHRKKLEANGEIATR
jgi:hypothetical protein